MTASSNVLPAGLIPPEVACSLARGYLKTRLPQRWVHTVGVATRALELADAAQVTGVDRVLLADAAWLHDVGYAVTSLSYTWHPLAGAALLRQWDLPPVANLVAWHSTAAEEAPLLGTVMEQVLSGYPRPDGLVADLLTVADMTTGPDGSTVTLQQRLVDIRARHGASSTAAQAMETAWPRLLLACARVQQAIDSA